MLEKPNIEAEKKEKRRLRHNSLMLFRRWVKGLSDFGRCDNPDCKNPGVHSHHIVLRSQGGDNDKSNGLYLCAVCHHFAHNGVVQSAADRIGIDVCTAREFVIDILTARCNRSLVDNERWVFTLVELRSKTIAGTEVQG